MKYESPTAGGSIQAFLNAFEPNAPFAQSLHDFNEMPQRTTEAIEFPDYNDVTLPRVVEGFIQSRSSSFRTTGNIGKNFFLSQPTWIKASICKSSDCEGVLTLAYPISIIVLWLQNFSRSSVKTHRIRDFDNLNLRSNSENEMGELGWNHLG